MGPNLSSKHTAWDQWNESESRLGISFGLKCVYVCVREEAPLGFTSQCDGSGIALSAATGCADRTKALTLLLVVYVRACECVYEHATSAPAKSMVLL